MSIWEAILLGLVQGPTEFLPISSSGHLILVPWLQEYTFLEANEAFNKTFDVALHMGTLVAVISYFWRDLGLIVAGFFRSLRRRAIGDESERLAWVIILATIPAVIVGGLGESWIDENLGEPWMIAILLIVFGIVLWYADRRPQDLKGTGKVGFRQGLIVGCAQALALAPGVSRSAVTITAGRFLKLDRDTAARFAFLLLVPVTAGAGVVKAYGAISDGLPPGVGWPIVAGVIASGVSGYLAIAGLLALVRRHTYNVFVVYRFVVAALILILIATGAREATF